MKYPRMDREEKKEKKCQDMNAIILIYAEKYSFVDFPHLFCYIEPNWS